MILETGTAAYARLVRNWSNEYNQKVKPSYDLPEYSQRILAFVSWIEQYGGKMVYSTTAHEVTYIRNFSCIRAKKSYIEFKDEKLYNMFILRYS